ncbi:MAG: aldo/keto reductase [Lachnospirales bacterium]
MYLASDKRYEKMEYRNCGKSGLKLPILSLGLWFNFGYKANFENCLNMATTAFDNGITHFDIANNYGPPAGTAEEMFSKILNKALGNYRDELIISTKAGYYMWEGPYGEWGSRKYITASLDQSLKRLGLDYVDIFYSHRFDPNTPLEETMLALDNAVKQGKALYVGISNYDYENTKKAVAILKELKTPYVLNQLSYSMINRNNEKAFEACMEEGMGVISFSTLSQGLLTNKYLKGIPEDSRYKLDNQYMKSFFEDNLGKVKELNYIAENRGQKLSQLALSWALNNKALTSTIIGASKPEQVLENIEVVNNWQLNDDEVKEINNICNK